MDENILIQVNLNDIKTYINNEHFISYISATSDISTALFIYNLLNKTIDHMLLDTQDNKIKENINNG